MSEQTELRKPRRTYIRHIKPEIFQHEGLHTLEETTGLPCRLALMGTWCVCDVDGRFEWRPKRMKLDVLPYDQLNFEAILDALVGAGFIHKYVVDSQTYGHVPTWRKHQYINRTKEPESTLPDPAVHCEICRELAESWPKGGQSAGKSQTVTVTETVNVTETVKHSTVPSTAASQVKREEQKNTETTTPDIAQLRQDEFDLRAEWKSHFLNTPYDPGDIVGLLQKYTREDLSGVMAWLEFIHKGSGKFGSWMDKINNTADFARCFKGMFPQYQKCGGYKVAMVAKAKFESDLLESADLEKKHRRNTPADAETQARIKKLAYLPALSVNKGEVFAVEDAKDTDGLS